MSHYSNMFVTFCNSLRFSTWMCLFLSFRFFSDKWPMPFFCRAWETHKHTVSQILSRISHQTSLQYQHIFDLCSPKQSSLSPSAIWRSRAGCYLQTGCQRWCSPCTLHSSPSSPSSSSLWPLSWPDVWLSSPPGSPAPSSSPSVSSCLLWWRRIPVSSCLPDQSQRRSSRNWRIWIQSVYVCLDPSLCSSPLCLSPSVSLGWSSCSVVSSPLSRCSCHLCLCFSPRWTLSWNVRSFYSFCCPFHPCVSSLSYVSSDYCDYHLKNLSKEIKKMLCSQSEVFNLLEFSIF